MEPNYSYQIEYDPAHQFKRFCREDRINVEQQKLETNMSPEIHGEMLYAYADLLESKVNKSTSTAKLSAAKLSP